MATRERWHELMVSVSPEELYQAVADAKKLAHWWTTGAPAIDGFVLKAVQPASMRP
jgi:uncharacterized protein YndB with AHSA1/START domain